MKLLRFILPIALLFVLPASNLRAQGEAGNLANVHELIGALAAMNLYNGHFSLGKIAKGDLSTTEQLDKAFREAGSFVGGTEAVLNSLKKALPDFPQNEQPQVQEFIRAHTLLIEEAEALKAWIQAKFDGSPTVKDAEVKFKAKRTEVTGIVAGLLGVDTSIVE